MEVDPNTGYMWIIDTGRRDTFTDAPVNACPAKLVVYDVRNGLEVRQHVFADDVLAREGNYVNDVVVAADGLWAYMSDTGVNNRGEAGEPKCVLSGSGWGHQYDWMPLAVK